MCACSTTKSCATASADEGRVGLHRRGQNAQAVDGGPLRARRAQDHVESNRIGRRQGAARGHPRAPTERRSGQLVVDERVAAEHGGVKVVLAVVARQLVSHIRGKPAVFLGNTVGVVVAMLGDVAPPVALVDVVSLYAVIILEAIDAAASADGAG